MHNIESPRSSSPRSSPRRSSTRKSSLRKGEMFVTIFEMSVGDLKKCFGSVSRIAQKCFACRVFVRKAVSGNPFRGKAFRETRCCNTRTGQTVDYIPNSGGGSGTSGHKRAPAAAAPTAAAARAGTGGHRRHQRAPAAAKQVIDGDCSVKVQPRLFVRQNSDTIICSNLVRGCAQY